MVSKWGKFKLWANLRQIGQRGGDGQVGRDRIRSSDCDSIDTQHQFFELADLAVLQRIANDDGALVFQAIASQTAQGGHLVRVGYVHKFEFWASLLDFGQRGADKKQALL